MNLIDLHMHSAFSDGTDSPEKLVEKAKEAGLSAIALTDHDTTAGNAQCALAANKRNIKFIPGVEISTRSEYGSHHILGLWTPEDNGKLNIFLDKMRDARKERNEKMLNKLQNLGISISEKDFPDMDLANLGRPHMANMLLEKGIVQNLGQAYGKYLGEKGAAYVRKNSPTPEEAIIRLTEAGATAIWAHPCLDKFDPEECEMLIRRFGKAGLSGIEVFHSKHDQKARNMLEKLAHKYNLAISGGSDYHGKNKPEILPGTGMNNLALPVSMLDNLEKIRKSQGLPC